MTIDLPVIEMRAIQGFRKDVISCVQKLERDTSLVEATPVTQKL